MTLRKLIRTDGTEEELTGPHAMADICQMIGADTSVQTGIDGIPDEVDRPHMIARISAIAVKLVYPFAARNDVRFYLNGINIRPLDDDSVMLVATKGRRYIVVRDPNGSAMISGDVAQPLFIQPGNALIDADFPRIERVASTIGYTEGISGAVNPSYLNDALSIGKTFGESIRFFTRDSDSPLTFVLGGLGDLECFGGIMKLRDSFEALPTWFPLPGAVETLADI